MATSGLLQLALGGVRSKGRRLAAGDDERGPGGHGESLNDHHEREDGNGRFQKEDERQTVAFA